MSVNILPNEILEEIFLNLKGTEVLKCRRVCQRWRDIVDGFSDKYWLETCKEEHRDVYKEAYRKASLSWRELYKPLTLWLEMASADVVVRKIAENTTIFHMLQNGVVAYPQRVQETCPMDQYDTIVYYNLLTEKETHREFIVSPFNFYKENDSIIVLGSLDNVVRVIPKADRLQVSHCTNVRILLDNQIYTQIGDKLSCIKFVETNNRLTLETEDCGDLKHEIKDFASVDSNHINIFTAGGLILSCIGQEIKFLTSFDTIMNDLKSSFEITERLKEFGFNWCSPPIFKYLHSRIRTFGPYVLEAVHTYGKLFFIGSCTPRSRQVHIYLNPFNANGELDFFNRTPDKSINLCINNKAPTFWHRDIKQIDVVETKNGHKILILFSSSIHVVDFTHGAPKKENKDKSSQYMCSLV